MEGRNVIIYKVDGPLGNQVNDFITGGIAKNDF